MRDSGRICAASTQRYTLSSSSVYYESTDGLVDPGVHTGLDYAWLFAPSNSAQRVPQGPQVVGINLRLAGGNAPTNGQPFEIVIRSFTFTPGS